MKETRMGYNEQRRLYYDKVMDLYFNQGLGYVKISRLVPVSRSGIAKWIVNFIAKNGKQYPPVMKETPKSITQSSSDLSDIESLQDKIARLESQLRKEKLRADAYDMMIDIAEKKFNIPIRKKAGAKQ
jgi:hypothetical protein